MESSLLLLFLCCLHTSFLCATVDHRSLATSLWPALTRYAVKFFLTSVHETSQAFYYFWEHLHHNKQDHSNPHVATSQQWISPPHQLRTLGAISGTLSPFHHAIGSAFSNEAITTWGPASMATHSSLRNGWTIGWLAKGVVSLCFPRGAWLCRHLRLNFFWWQWGRVQMPIPQCRNEAVGCHRSMGGED